VQRSNAQSNQQLTRERKRIGMNEKHPTGRVQMTHDKLSEDELDTLEACLRNGQPGRIMPYEIGQLIAGYRELLALRSATPMPEPVAWMTEDGRVASDETKRTAMARVSKAVFCIPLYTAPPAREISEAGGDGSERYLDWNKKP
jgi:hypothetical protein